MSSTDPNAWRPLIPGTSEQLIARRREMRRAVDLVASLHASGRRDIPDSAFDELKATFPVPVQVRVDWEGTEESGHPMLAIQVVPRPVARIMESLSRRETEVAALICEGLTNGQIAQRLGIAVTTVKDHVHHILARTGLRNRSALAAAIRR